MANSLNIRIIVLCNLVGYLFPIFALSDQFYLPISQELEEDEDWLCSYGSINTPELILNFSLL